MHYILAAGDIFGLNKSTAIAYKEHGEEHVRTKRWNGLNNPKSSDFDIARVSNDHGVEMIDPYRDLRICEWMINDIPLNDLHIGKPKSIVVDAFADYWKLDEKKWYRKGNNLQIVSGIRKLHDDILLSDSEVNKRGSKAVIAIYNDIRKNRLNYL